MAVSWVQVCSTGSQQGQLRYAKVVAVALYLGTDCADKTIQPNVIADVMFLHERGIYQTLYFAFYFGSLMVGCYSSHTKTSPYAVY